MSQFDVYRNPNRRGHAYAPFVVVLQSDIIETPGTIVVAPLVRSVAPGQRPQLQRAVVVNGEPLIVMFSTPSTVSPASLGSRVASLPELADVFVKAIDLLFVGF